jgi:hypothetical protein
LRNCLRLGVAWRGEPDRGHEDDGFLRALNADQELTDWLADWLADRVGNRVAKCSCISVRVGVHTGINLSFPLCSALLCSGVVDAYADGDARSTMHETR